MLQATLAHGSSCGDSLSVQHIAQSLERYKSSLRFDVPKTATDQMEAMCAIARCSNQPFLVVLESHVHKRKNPKQATSRFRFGAALEAYALHVQTTIAAQRCAIAVRQSASFVNSCLLRAERNILTGYAHDPQHAHANAFFCAHPMAAPYTLSNLATRLTLASLHQPRIAPTVFAPFCVMPALPEPQRTAHQPYTAPAVSAPSCVKPVPVAPQQAKDPAIAALMLPPPPRPPALAKMARAQPHDANRRAPQFAMPQGAATPMDGDFLEFLQKIAKNDFEPTTLGC